MLPFEDVQLQLIDLPPISASFMESWMPNALVHADAALLVVDIGDPAAILDVGAIRRELATKRILLRADAEDRIEDHEEQDVIDDRQRLPTVMVVNKADLLGDDPMAELEVFCELCDVPFSALLVSARSGAGLDRIGRTLFDLLGVVRVYTKVPGHAAEKGRPFAVRRGATVQDVARLVHRGLASEVKTARIWGTGAYAGQLVARDHLVVDGDLIELHW